MPEVTVVRGDEVDPESMAEFFRHSWDETATAEKVRASRARAARTNPVEPGVTPHDVAYLVDGRVVGYLGTLPVRFWDGSAEHGGSWLKGFMVLPEYRNGPVGFSLLRKINREVGLAGSILVAEPARKLLAALGYEAVGTLSDRILILRGGRFLSRLAPEGIPGVPARLRGLVSLVQRVGIARWVGGVGSAALLLQRGVVARLGTGGLTFARERPGEEELDALWRRVRAGLEAAPVRDSSYLFWRYGTGREGPYTFLTARRAGGLEGVAVLKVPTASEDPRLEGIQVGTLSDMVFPPGRPEVGRGLACFAASVAHGAGGDALVAGASHPVLNRVLGRAGFLRVARSLHFYLRGGPGGPELPPDVEAWWLTRGDGGADYGL